MSADTFFEHLQEIEPVLAEKTSVHDENAWLDLDTGAFYDTMARLYDMGFDRLGMVTAVDDGEAITMVYRLTSRALSAGLFVKVKLERDEPHILSVVELWPAANWQEREVWDLFGVRFDGHPDLRRMFLPEEWVGHPLRKDYEDDRIIRRPDYI